MSNFWSVSAPNGPPWIAIVTFAARSLYAFTAASDVIVSADCVPVA